MAKGAIEADFPSLAGKDYELSDEDFNYNCLAFALGDLDHWWEPPIGQGRYWPPGFPNDTTVLTVESIIKIHGFTVELGKETEPSNEAIAIYAAGDEWEHFAKFSNGTWSCKLGEGHDVTGVALKDLEGPLYGTVVKILCRPKEVGRRGIVRRLTDAVIGVSAFIPSSYGRTASRP